MGNSIIHLNIRFVEQLCNSIECSSEGSHFIFEISHTDDYSDSRLQLCNLQGNILRLENIMWLHLIWGWRWGNQNPEYLTSVSPYFSHQLLYLQQEKETMCGLIGLIKSSPAFNPSSSLVSKTESQNQMGIHRGILGHILNAVCRPECQEAKLYYP